MHDRKSVVRDHAWIPESQCQWRRGRTAPRTSELACDRILCSRTKGRISPLEHAANIYFTWYPVVRMPIPSVSAMCEATDMEPSHRLRFSGRFLDSGICHPGLFKKWLGLCVQAHGNHCQNPPWLSKIE